MTMQAVGMKTVTLEGSDRIGGRLYTLDDVSGRPEAGGEQVGQTYARIRYAAEQTGIRITDGASGEREPRALAVGDTILAPSVWKDSALNPFPDTFRSAAPDSALFAAAARSNPFSRLDDWSTEAGRRADFSAAEFLRNEGFNDQSLRLINVALNGNDLETYSMINLWRSLTLFAKDRELGASGSIEGGAQRLPEAMAAKLGAVHTGSTVRAIEQDAHGVVVRTDAEIWRADYCILALPFPAVEKIALDPAPTGMQAAAIAGLPYTQILQLHLEPEMQFWEQDGIPLSMWSDGPLERIFVKRNEKGGVTSLTAWINGDAARDLARDDDASLEMLARSEFKRLRPASEGRVRLLKAVRWTNGASYAGGAYMHWAPGQVQSWAEEMAAPLGRIFFAGEHLSYLHTGMEGAMEAGERAALAILEASGA